MKYLREFESYTIKRKRDEIIKESVLLVNDTYKVRAMVDIPQTLVNAYVKKVKEASGKNLRQYFSDVDIAEEIVKYVNLTFINVDQVPSGALMGEPQAQPESMEMEAQPQAQAQAQPQIQSQPEAQPQAQAQPQGEAQPQVTVETESQPQSDVESDEDFQEVRDEDEDESDEGSEELPA